MAAMVHLAIIAIIAAAAMPELGATPAYDQFTKKLAKGNVVWRDVYTGFPQVRMHNTPYMP